MTAKRPTVLPTTSPMLRRSAGAAADLDIVITLEEGLRVAFGPTGSGVLLREGSTGILAVTRAAREIARGTFDGSVPPPWLIPILRAGEDIERRAGDGGKGVLLGALAVSRMQLPQKVSRDLLTLSDHIAGIGAPNNKPPREKIPLIVHTCLRTRLTPVVISTVLPIILSWLDQDHEFALRHIDALCRVEVKMLSPLAGTVSDQGVVFHGISSGIPKTQQRLRLVVLQEEDVPKTDIAGVIIASRKCLEEKVVARLVSGGAAVVHGLTDADVHLASCADGSDLEVKCVPNGVWLGIPGVRYIVVHAPMPSLAREIARCIRDVLALVNFSDCRLVPAGALERCVLRRLLRMNCPRWRSLPIGRKLLLTLSSPVPPEEAMADDVASTIVDLCKNCSPEVVAAVGSAVSASLPLTSTSSATLTFDGIEPVTLRLAVLQGAVSAGALSLSASAPLPAHRLHS